MATQFAVFHVRGTFEEVAAAVLCAEAEGFDSVLFGEHHGAEGTRFPQLLNLLSALAARTERICLGTSILLSPLYNPVRLAEEAAQVDVISNGRLILGLGLGYVPRDFNHFGVPFRQRLSRFEEGIEVIRKAWTERPFAFVGKRYQFTNVSVYPVPVQRPHPPIWLAGWTMAGVVRAARQGDAWVTDPIQNRSGLVAMAQQYQRERQAQGGAPKTVLMREIIIGKTRAEALESYGDGILATYRNYWTNGAFNTQWDAWAEHVQSAEEITLEEVLRDRVVAGSPDECVEQLRSWIDAVGADCVQLILPANRGGSGTNLEAIQLIGREVLPAVRARA